MHQYEIRILRDNNRPFVVSSRFIGDFHAIRRAQAMAEEDEGMEVWRGMQCIYRRDPLPSDLLPDHGHRVQNFGAGLAATFTTTDRRRVGRDAALMAPCVRLRAVATVSCTGFA